MVCDFGVVASGYAAAAVRGEEVAGVPVVPGVGGVERAADDPLTISRIGELAIRIEAAEAVLERAGRKVDLAQVNLSQENSVAATLAVAAAKVLTTELAIDATNVLFELAGTSATKRGLNLERHWRNARTHTLHDPVRWKYAILGNYYLNGVNPPLHAWS